MGLTKADKRLNEFIKRLESMKTLKEKREHMKSLIATGGAVGVLIGVILSVLENKGEK